ncbi:MAG: thioredoxin family protein [Methanocellales archaeon]|nr:thioredoxin family protein [Methanocellales archaeon]MDD3291510.1 thioredoxin family protein [Methanocellales archaeon]MDD5234600.1 thioredoxin family protein [Methanocellales archaeon]MDD5485047.1 thioredoxin family protein [Methanocellales archaeon]
MEIKILGVGCPKCERMEKNVKKVIEDIGIRAEVEKVKDIENMMEYGIMMTPALVINNKTKCQGRIPSTEEIKSWLK